DAIKVAAILQNYFDKLKAVQGTGNRQDVFVPVTVFAEERTNRVIVSADPTGMQQARALIDKLDVKAGAPTQQVQVYPLKQTSAARIAPLITKVFEERAKGRTGGAGAAQVPETPVTIQADDITNSLIVSASRDDQALIADLVL